ncbi:zinc finger protein DZIP1L [Anopheles merus]|uniref:C2H2-type domain-containing protein n=1 Tax=Anopheles merus TaxID=30066 RepID=A0A9I3MHF1_ANOME|nr:zinc finger protein DZIP1L [Anopheles merus]
MSYKWHHNFPKIAREAGFTIRELSVGHCIDWRFIASIDPYGIVSDKDYEKLDEFIPHISEVPIGNVLSNRILDPAIGKYFVLAQFSIQYLLFCKQFLDETVLEIRNTIQTLQDENARLEKMNKKRSEEVTQLQRKLQRAETMEHQQHAQPIYPCTKCTKNFISSELLNAHMVRKHASNVQRTAEPTLERKPATTDTNLINTIKLELEVKQLKERLNATEKDLHLHRSKHHRCRVCSEDSSSATDRPPAKVLHSVAIQSNLTDDKDSNDEKVAQTQTETMPQSEKSAIDEQRKDRAPAGDFISKSDLQSFLDEQRRLFESWKTGERQTLNQEIETVKRNLVDVIQTIEKSERNTPTPVVVDESGGIWKERYRELEKIYETSQRQAQEAIVSFEKVYTQKVEQLEKLLREARAIERKEIQNDSSTGHTDLGTPHSLTHLKTVTLPTVVIESVSVVEDPVQQKEEYTKHNMQTISSESEQAESDKEHETNTNIETLKTHHQLAAKSSPLVETSQKPSQVTESKPQAQPSSQALLISPKKQILTQFRARLKAIGVDPRSKLLFGENLNAACKALADRRDVQRQKHGHFFVTRNQLLSRVEQLARVKIGDGAQTKESGQMKTAHDKPIVMGREKHFPSARGPVIKPRLKTSSAMELLPSKQKLHLPDTGAVQHHADMNVFKSKAIFTGGSSAPPHRPTIKLTDDDIITVHADVTAMSGQEDLTITPNPSKRASISSYDQQVERLLHTPIKTIHPAAKTPDRVQDSTVEETIPSSNNETIDSVSTLKPIPKKRVLFNLDKEDYTRTLGTSVVVSAGQPGPVAEEYARSHQKPNAHTVSKVDDESDWNISSFDEDK